MSQTPQRPQTRANFEAKPSANSYIPEVEIKQGAENLKQTLEGMPYTSEGKGAVIYVFEYSDCPVAQLRYKDWKGKLEGVELRHFFYPTNQRSANETAALALSRDVVDYYANMEHRKTAPDERKTNQSIDAYNSITGPLRNIIVPILHMNGWTRSQIVSPNYFWEVDGKWYSEGGYEHGRFENIMNMGVLNNINKAAQQNPRTPDTGQSVNTQPAAPKSASDVSAIATTMTGETQPDILGIKIGMPTVEVRPILRDRHLQKYAERKSHLTFTNGDFAQEPIPGDFISLISTYSPYIYVNQIDDHIDAFMTPTAGTERVAYVGRSVFMRKKEIYLLLSTFKAALIAKYGKPAANDDEYTWMLWRFNARPTSLNSNQLSVRCKAINLRGLGEDWVDERRPVSNWVLDFRLITLPQMVVDCGGTYLRADIILANRNAPPEQRLVQGYSLQLSGLALAIEALNRVDAVVAAAKQAHDKQILERAKSQKADP